jgi:hypothetical protein
MLPAPTASDGQVARLPATLGWQWNQRMAVPLSGYWTI